MRTSLGLGLIAALGVLLTQLPHAQAQAAASTAPAAPVTVAATDGATQYAILIGANVGGPGQPELRYAEDDARKMNEVLTELSGYRSSNIIRLNRPTPMQLIAAIDRIRDRIVADQINGNVSRVLFYYSGHAKASALNLGDNEFPLDDLRARLTALPSKLTVVVLDACQSGAFSRIKGATGAADFSINSKARLDATGIAVLASSTGSELSQESETLRSSYFTHHLLVGMRGAADSNRDGRVSVDEGYRYAYSQTLLATSQTAVGGQHVTLEVDLKGHGEIPLSYPQPATAKLELPGDLKGHAVIEHVRSHSVIAEIEKVRGAPIRLALAPGEYRVLLRDGNELRSCPLTAAKNAVATVDIDRCERLAIVDSARKGDAAPRFERPTSIMISVVTGSERDDAFIENLRNFAYTRDGITSGAGVSTGVIGMVTQRIHPHFSVGGSAEWHDSSFWRRPTELSPLTFEWSTAAISALAVADVTLGDDGIARQFRPYALVGAGLGLGRTTFFNAYDTESNELFAGYALTAGVGLNLDARRMNRITDGMTVTLGYRFNYAPIISNLIGDTHASGGGRFEFGLGYRF